MADGRFKDRVVFVTGAASGVGRAAAERFATEGARVFGVDVNRDGVSETVATIRRAGGCADGGHCNVADPAAVEASIARAVELFGGLHVLVNAEIGRAHV